MTKIVKMPQYIERVLTADGDPPRGLHGRPVAVVRVAGDVPHLPGDVVDDGDHVAGDVAVDGVPGYVEGHGGHRGAHGDTEDSHRAALSHHVDRVDGRGLDNSRGLVKYSDVVLLNSRNVYYY